MICEQINTCHFFQCVSKVMPVTAITIKAKYCDNYIYGCAKHQEHEVIAIDKERGNLFPGYVIDGLIFFEKEYNKSYKKLCVRRIKETKENNRLEFI